MRKIAFKSALHLAIAASFSALAHASPGLESSNEYAALKAELSTLEGFTDALSMLNPQMDSHENTTRLAKRYALVLRESSNVDIDIYEKDTFGLADPAKQAAFAEEKTKNPDQASCSVAFTAIVPGAVAMTLASSAVDIVNPRLPTANQAQARDQMRQSLRDVRSIARSLCAGSDSVPMQLAIGQFLDRLDADAQQISSKVRLAKSKADKQAVIDAGYGHLLPGGEAPAASPQE